MIQSVRPPPATRGRPDVVGPLLWAVPGGILAWVSHWGLFPSLILLGSAAGAGLLLSLPRWGLGPALPILPGVVALGALASSSPAGPVPYLLAGAGGLALVLSVGRAAAEPGRRGAATGALQLPALALGIALSTALLFPPAERFVGVAALLLLLTVTVLALLLRRPASALEAEG